MNITPSDAVLKALQVVVNVLRRNPSTGQSRILIEFLAGLYDGAEYLFNLTDLRRLDENLCQACLLILAWNSLGRSDEIHTWGIFKDKELHWWLNEYVFFNRPDKQIRDGLELYKERYGTTHADEGLTG